MVFFQIKNTIVLATTYFPRAPAQVSSALEGLTSEFGKGSGVTPPLLSPEQWCFLISEFLDNKFSKQKCGRIKRFISTAQLNALLRLHLRPIKVLVSDQSMKPDLRDSFVLRCFQLLS